MYAQAPSHGKAEVEAEIKKPRLFLEKF